MPRLSTTPAGAADSLGQGDTLEAGAEQSRAQHLTAASAGCSTAHGNLTRPPRMARGPAGPRMISRRATGSRLW